MICVSVTAFSLNTRKGAIMIFLFSIKAVHPGFAIIHNAKNADKFKSNIGQQILL